MLLRRLRRPSVEKSATPRVIGVDDFAFRRGQRYGTLLVDLERHCPIDLPTDCEAETLSAWLKTHPGTEVVTRDRSKSYVAALLKALQRSHRWPTICSRTIVRHWRDCSSDSFSRSGSAQSNASALPSLTRLGRMIFMNVAAFVCCRTCCAVRGRRRREAFARRPSACPLPAELHGCCCNQRSSMIRGVPQRRKTPYIVSCLLRQDSDNC